MATLRKILRTMWCVRCGSPSGNAAYCAACRAGGR